MIQTLNLDSLLQAAAGFTPAQKHALLGMRSTFLGRLQGIIEQRRKIIFELHDSVPDSQSSTLTDVTIAKARPLAAPRCLHVCWPAAAPLGPASAAGPKP